MILKDLNNLKKVYNICNHTNQYYAQNIDLCEINTDVGYLNLLIITGLENIPLPQAFVTIYAKTSGNNQIPIMRLVSRINPILVQLPVAHYSGTYIKGPEYCFTYYDIYVTTTGYYPTRILNIRMFPEITTNFNISMIPVAEENPSYEHKIELPPHERDII